MIKVSEKNVCQRIRRLWKISERMNEISCGRFTRARSVQRREVADIYQALTLHYHELGNMHVNLFTTFMQTPEMASCNVA